MKQLISIFELLRFSKCYKTTVDRTTILEEVLAHANSETLWFTKFKAKEKPDNLIAFYSNWSFGTMGFFGIRINANIDDGKKEFILKSTIQPGLILVCVFAIAFLVLQPFSDYNDPINFDLIFLFLPFIFYFIYRFQQVLLMNRVAKYLHEKELLSSSKPITS